MALLLCFGSLAKGLLKTIDDGTFRVQTNLEAYTISKQLYM